jgi:hypothetical protein
MYAIKYFMRVPKNGVSGHGVANYKGITAHACFVWFWAIKIKWMIWQHRRLLWDLGVLRL